MTCITAEWVDNDLEFREGAKDAVVLSGVSVESGTTSGKKRLYKVTIHDQKVKNRTSERTLCTAPL